MMPAQKDWLDLALSIALTSMLYILCLLAAQWALGIGPKALLAQAVMQGIVILAALGSSTNK